MAKQKRQTRQEKESNKVEFEGIIDETLPGWNYKVILSDINMSVICMLSGKMKLHNIKIIAWDKVKVELNEIDPTKWRITYRVK